MSQGTTKGVPIDVDGTLSLNSDLLVPSQKAVKTYADTKEASVNKATTMTGNTGDNTLFLSAKAIYDWAIGFFIQIGQSARRKIHNYQNTDSVVTGSTNQTVGANLLVVGGSMGANGLLEMRSRITKNTAGTGTVTVRYYLSTDSTNTVGTTGTPTNATLIGTYISGTQANVYAVINRSLINKNSESLNDILLSTNNAVSDEGVAIATTLTTTNINTAVDLYFVETLQLSSSADTATIKNVQLYINKP